MDKTNEKTDKREKKRLEKKKDNEVIWAKKKKKKERTKKKKKTLHRNVDSRRQVSGRAQRTSTPRWDDSPLQNTRS
jgi:hypothetical protein